MACELKALQANLGVWIEMVIFLMIYEFLRVWKKRAFCDEEKMRKGKAVSDLERISLSEVVSWR